MGGWLAQTPEPCGGPQRPGPTWRGPLPSGSAATLSATLKGPRAHTEGPRLPPRLLRGQNHTAAFPGGRGRPPSGPRAWAAVHTSTCATWATRRSAEANATFEGASARLCENVVQIGRCRSLVETSAAQDECVPEVGRGEESVRGQRREVPDSLSRTEGLEGQRSSPSPSSGRTP